jgi:hypothetical protein
VKLIYACLAHHVQQATHETRHFLVISLHIAELLEQGRLGWIAPREM